MKAKTARLVSAITEIAMLFGVAVVIDNTLKKAIPYTLLNLPLRICVGFVVMLISSVVNRALRRELALTIREIRNAWRNEEAPNDLELALR